MRSARHEREGLSQFTHTRPYAYLQILSQTPCPIPWTQAVVQTFLQVDAYVHTDSLLTVHPQDPPKSRREVRPNPYICRRPLSRRTNQHLLLGKLNPTDTRGSLFGAGRSQDERGVGVVTCSSIVICALLVFNRIGSPPSQGNTFTSEEGGMVGDLCTAYLTSELAPEPHPQLCKPSTRASPH